MDLFEFCTLSSNEFLVKIISVNLHSRDELLDGSKSHRRKQWNVYASDFEIAQNSNHSLFFILSSKMKSTCFYAEFAHFFSSNYKMALFCLDCTFSSNFEPSRNFRAKNTRSIFRGESQGKIMWFEFYAGTCHCVLRWPFEPSQNTLCDAVPYFLLVNII